MSLLVGKTEGAFLYLQYARETHLSDYNLQETGEGESVRLTMERLEQMPTGLTQLYGQEFVRIEEALRGSGQFETMSRKWTPAEVAEWLRGLRGGQFAQ